jgi:hypothetical protein
MTQFLCYLTTFAIGLAFFTDSPIGFNILSEQVTRIKLHIQNHMYHIITQQIIKYIKQTYVIFIEVHIYTSGACVCDTGYSGVDCSSPGPAPTPSALYIQHEGLCASRTTRDCAAAVVFGVGFQQADNLTCHMLPMRVRQGVTADVELTELLSTATQIRKVLTALLTYNELVPFCSERR